MERETVIEWSEVKDQFLRCVVGGERWQQHQGARLARLHAAPDAVNAWEGGSGNFTVGVLRHGFKADAFRSAAKRMPEASTRRSRFNQTSGRPSAARVAAGDPNLFKRRQRVDRKPGIRVKIQCGFSASMSVDQIADYGASVAALLKTLQNQGFDMTIDLWIALDGLFSDRPNRGQRENVYVRVKKQGERADFTEWSGIFGPTGYRHLTFTAKCVAADQIGQRATGTLGKCIASDWGVSYDRKTNEVEITASQFGTFNAENFKQQASEAGLI
jgi:hypothetical protein